MERSSLLDIQEMARILKSRPLRQMLAGLKCDNFFFNHIHPLRVEGPELVRDCREYMRHSRRFMEGWIILSGRYRVEIDGQLTMMKRGDCALLSPGVAHAGYVRQGDAYRSLGWLLFPLSLTLYIVETTRGSCRPRTYGHCIFRRFELPELDVIDYLPTRLSYWPPEKMASGAGHYLSNLFDAAVMLLEQFHARFAKTQDRAAAKADEIEELIRSQYHTALTLQSIAEAVGLSAAYCCDVFSRSRKVSPVAYLSQVRLDAAARLLATTDLLAKQVARKVGFTDANYFARRFHQVFGVSPVGYRQSVRH